MRRVARRHFVTGTIRAHLANIRRGGWWWPWRWLPEAGSDPGPRRGAWWLPNVEVVGATQFVARRARARQLAHAIARSKLKGGARRAGTAVGAVGTAGAPCILGTWAAVVANGVGGRGASVGAEIRLAGTAVGAVGTAGAPCILGPRTAVVTLGVGGIVASLGAGLTDGIYRRARIAVGAVGTAGAPCILGTRAAVVADGVGGRGASVGAGFWLARTAVGAVGTAGAPCMIGTRAAVVALGVGVILASIGAKCSWSGELLKGVAPGGTRRKRIVYCVGSELVGAGASPC